MTHRPGETVNAHIVSPIISPRVTPYPLSAVDVADDSVFAAARGRMLDLARNYPVDRLLAVFGRTLSWIRGERGRQELETMCTLRCLERARLSGAGRGTDRQPAPRALRRHFSPCSLAQWPPGGGAQGQGDGFRGGPGPGAGCAGGDGPVLPPRLPRRVRGAAVLAIEGFAPYGEIWAPYYTTHKIMQPWDAYELNGNEQALRIVTKMGQWAHARLSRLIPTATEDGRCTSPASTADERPSPASPPCQAGAVPDDRHLLRPGELLEAG